MKVLAPIRHRDAYTLAVEKELRAYLDETLFGPLRELLEWAAVPGTRDHARARLNAGPHGSAVAQALKDGRLWYADGEFSGELSAAVSRELRAMGAKLNPARGTFSLPPDRLPHEIAGAAEQSLDRSRKLHQQLQDTLVEIEANALGLATGLRVERVVEKIVDDLTKQFDGTLPAGEAIEIEAEMTPGLVKALSEDLTHNLDRYVKGYVEEEIVALRTEIQQNAFAGFRADRLAQIIAARDGITKRKAAFLAEQETSLVVSKYREVRYKEIGALSYVWATSHDEKVRPDHRVLNGKKFSWDNPPITNRKSGARNNPGEDFRCRCVAMPILEGLALESSLPGKSK